MTQLWGLFHFFWLISLVLILLAMFWKRHNCLCKVSRLTFHVSVKTTWGQRTAVLKVTKSTLAFIFFKCKKSEVTNISQRPPHERIGFLDIVGGGFMQWGETEGCSCAKGAKMNYWLNLLVSTRFSFVFLGFWVQAGQRMFDFLCFNIRLQHIKCI